MFRKPVFWASTQLASFRLAFNTGVEAQLTELPRGRGAIWKATAGIARLREDRMVDAIRDIGAPVASILFR